MAKASARQVDFTNVREGSIYNNKRIESGDYLAKIKAVADSEVKTGNNKGTAQYEFAIQIVELPSSVLPYRCQLTENQLWKLRNILIAAGKTVPKRKVKVDPNQLVGKLIGVSVEDDEYQDKNGDTKETSQIQGVFPAADLGDNVAVGDDTEEDEDDEDQVDSPLEEEDDDEAPEADDDEADDEADEEEEDDSEAARIAGLNRTQLKAEIIKIQSDFQARKSQSDDDLRDVLTGLLEADGDEEEEPPAKAKKPAAKKAPTKAAPKASAKRKAKPKAEEIDDEELDELDIDNL